MFEYVCENSSLKSGIALKGIIHIKVSEKWQHSASYCDTYKLFFVKSGKLRLWCTPGHVEINKGFALIFEPGTRIRSGFSPDTGVEFYEVSFDTNDAFFKTSSVCRAPDRESAEAILALIYKARFESFATLKKDALLYSLLCEIFASISVSTSKEAELLEKTFTYIENNLTCDFDFDALAKYLECDRSHISRIFSKAAKKTLKAYVNERRVAACSDLLASSSYDINKIASLMGFEESNLFTKFFTYHTGTTPSDYRRSVYGTKPFNG